MKEHSKWTSLAVCCLALLTLHCAQQPAADNRAADEAAIREADMAWSKIAETKQVDQHTAYFLEDGVVLAPNEAIVTGKEAIRKKLGEYFAMPGFGIRWQPTKVEASRSGDLGYSMGTYEMALNDPKGNPTTDHGKYVTVWKKQDDGSWKVAADMFNSDLPAEQAPTKAD